MAPPVVGAAGEATMVQGPGLSAAIFPPVAEDGEAQSNSKPPETEKEAPTPRSFLASKTTNMTVLTTIQAARMMTSPGRAERDGRSFLAICMCGCWWLERSMERGVVGRDISCSRKET